MTEMQIKSKEKDFMESKYILISAQLCPISIQLYNGRLIGADLVVHIFRMFYLQWLFFGLVTTPYVLKCFNINVYQHKS